MNTVAGMAQLFLFGLASPFCQIRIVYLAHCWAPKQIQNEYSVQP